MMDVICRCAACSTQFKVDAKYAGKKAKCPKCATLTLVPSPSQTGSLTNTSTIAANASTDDKLSPPKPDAKRSRFLDSQLTNASVTAPDLSHVQQPPAKANSAPTPATTPAPVPPPPTKPSERLLSRAAASKNTTVNSGLNLNIEPPTAKTPPVTRPRKSPGKKIPPIVWVVGGGIAALLLVVGVIAAIVMMSFRNPVLIVHWPESERAGATLLIDNKKPSRLTNSGPLKFDLEPGNHRVVILRRGFEQIDYAFVLKKGEEFEYRPEWVKREAVIEKPNPEKVANGGTTSGSFPTPPNNGSNTESPDGPQGFAGWLQLFDTAKRRATEQKKDIFLVFSGSDTFQPSIKMTNDIFTNSKFLDFAKQRFVLLVIDTPRTAIGYNLLADAAQNQFLVRQFGIERVPTILLTDAAGAPYAVHGYSEKSVDEYVNFINLQSTNHPLRDDLLRKANQSQDWGERLALAEETLKFLRNQTIPRATTTRRATEQTLETQRDLGLAKFYPTLLANWLRTARRVDEKNEKGKLEIFFEVDWRVRISNQTDDRLKEGIIKELDQWGQQYKFQDQDRAASLYLLAAIHMEGLQKESEVLRYLELAVQCKPQTPSLAEAVQGIAKLLKSKDLLSSGTGFIIDGKGFLLTNYHVIEGPGRVVVRRPDNGDQVPAEVVAQDPKRDIALLKVDPQKFAEFQSIAVTPAPVGRGARVAMFGYPLGDVVGTGIKLTTGGVSGLPDDSNDQMLLIDGRVNPGNSGGPLCNAVGDVVGMVTAKSRSGGGLDSYGMALPAKDLQAFLQKNLPDYTPVNVNKPADSLEWDAVDQLVSPAVMMILKLRR